MFAYSPKVCLRLTFNLKSQFHRNNNYDTFPNSTYKLKFKNYYPNMHLLSGPPSLFTASTKRSWSSCVQRRRSLAVAEPRRRCLEPITELLGSESPNHMGL